MAELLLNVRDLHAGYGRAEVLHGLNITARAGKVPTTRTLCLPIGASTPVRC